MSPPLDDFSQTSFIIPPNCSLNFPGGVGSFSPQGPLHPERLSIIGVIPLICNCLNYFYFSLITWTKVYLFLLRLLNSPFLFPIKPSWNQTEPRKGKTCVLIATFEYLITVVSEASYFWTFCSVDWAKTFLSLSLILELVGFISLGILIFI